MDNEAEQQVREAIDKILKDNITLHSIRQGYGVFNITSFETIRDQILSLKYPSGQPMIGKLAEKQVFPEMADFGTKEHQIQKGFAERMYDEGWRKCL